MMAESKKLGKKGQVIHSQGREIVHNVAQFMRQEAEARAPVIPLQKTIERVLAATKISKSSYLRIEKEARSLDAGEGTSFSTPRKQRPKPSPKSSLPEHEMAEVRRIIHNIYLTEKRRPTLRCILQKLEECNVPYEGKLSSFRKLVHKLGFKWRKTSDRRKVLTETQKIRSLRVKYLRKIIEYRAENRPIIYIDETYLHSSHTTPKEWSDNSSEGLKAPISKGQRLIIVHAGSEDGFVPNALLIFKSGTKSGDYHDEMNAKNFRTWMEKQLLPNLPPNSVVVMDNASYHNIKSRKEPTSNTVKAEMISWLRDKKVQFDETVTKVELYELIKQYKGREVSYSVDELLNSKGHVALRLPPYHPDLNPIETIWAMMKNWVASRNVTFKLSDVEALARERFTQISHEEWRAVCDRVKRIENEYMKNEYQMDEVLEVHFMVNTGSSDEEDDEQSDGDDDDDDEVFGQPLP